jgi:aspartate kinase
MNILVQKFGGTSVSTLERRQLVAQKIIKAKEDGYSPVIVVSAMGRSGDPYATDSLLALIDEKFINKNHQATDLLISCGEIISTVILSDELYKSNIESVPLTGGLAGILTDSNYNNANIKDVFTKNLLSILKDNKTPVVAGFQGQNNKGYITTLGRGGSDVTAALLGVALNASCIEIYTDVDGIMTADPRIVSEASLIDQLNYNEVFQFADQGAKVIHPRAIEIAMKANIPIVIKNTLNDCKGTIINNENNENSTKLITGITHMSNRVQIKVTLANNVGNKLYNNMLELLAKGLISIDLINIFPKEYIFTIDAKDVMKLDELMNKSNLNFTYIKNCSKIAIIGSRITGIPGVMARILRALTNENIEVLQTADSNTTIWCLVESKYTQLAINALHREFDLS